MKIVDHARRRGLLFSLLGVSTSRHAVQPNTQPSQTLILSFLTIFVSTQNISLFTRPLSPLSLAFFFFLRQGCGPGEVFIHRNIANQFMHNDVSMLASLHYAVDYLGVRVYLRG